jgi:hypothetical protein
MERMSFGARQECTLKKFHKFPPPLNTSTISMARKSRLLAALDAQRGRDYKLERQKKLAKKAVGAKKLRMMASEDPDGGEDDANGIQGAGSGEAFDGSRESSVDEASGVVCSNVCGFFRKANHCL